MARYEALKVYLMLAEPARLIQKEVEAWFINDWKTSAPETPEAQSLALLRRALQKPLQPMSINQQMVSDARNVLNALPATYLYYTLAKQAFSQEKKPLPLAGFSLSTNALPVYLTKAGFQQVFARLPEITSELQKNNWVLGGVDLSDLHTLLQEAYCYEYVTWWQNFMKHTKPSPIQNYNEARQLTKALRESNAISTLVSLLQQQLGPDAGPHAPLFNQQIASKFTELSLMSHSTLEHLNLTLNELEQFLTTLSIVNDGGKTAFFLIKAQFQGDALNNPLSNLYAYAKQLPAPVSAWAKQMADDTAFTLMSDTKRYINQQWKETVLNAYEQTIAHRYPFDLNQEDEISIADFNHFFATHGVLNTFVEQYLKPFLDTSEPQWKLKATNDYVLPIDPNMVDELIRANIITHMFFPHGHEASHIQFSLQKLSLDPVVSSFRLAIGENSLHDTQNTESFTEFQWPNTHARLTLNSIEGNHYELEEEGPWAFFKMLQKVNVLVDEEDNARLQILFEVNGNSGRYLLKTENAVNPFTPGILNGFALPEAVV